MVSDANRVKVKNCDCNWGWFSVFLIWVELSQIWADLIKICHNSQPTVKFPIVFSGSLRSGNSPSFIFWHCQFQVLGLVCHNFFEGGISKKNWRIIELIIEEPKTNKI